MPSRLLHGGTPAIRQAANEQAADVWDTWWWEETLPVDPVQIALRMGAEVYSAQLGNDVFGMLVGTPKGGVQIYLDDDQPPNRYRFSAAHELGHYVERSAREDQDGSDVSYIDRRSDKSRGEPEEVFANQFAGALLMPDRMLRREIRRGASDMQLARRFGVSLDAMTYRRRIAGL